MNWIDTHCHLDAPEFDTDRSEVLSRARAVGVAMLVLPAVQASQFDAVRSLAHSQGLAYALGIHPLYVGSAADEDLDRLADELRRYADDPRLVAVGEIGLDHFVPGLDLARQERFYTAQLKLARAAHDADAVLLPCFIDLASSAHEPQARFSMVYAPPARAGSAMPMRAAGASGTGRGGRRSPGQRT